MLSDKGSSLDPLFRISPNPNLGDGQMKKRNFAKLMAVALAFSATTFSFHANADPKMVLKASDVHPMGYPTVEAIVRMGKKLETATNGRISIQMFPSMQLGGEKEMIEQAQIGALQIARISVGAMGPVVDEVNVFNMPFVFRDEAHMRKVIDGPIGQDLLERMTNGPGSRLVALGWMDAGTRNVYAKKAVTTPEDLKGMKIRMMGNPLFVETMNAMGGNGVAMGFNELLPALQTGVVDGAENNPPTLLAQNHYTVSKVMSLTGHLIIPEIFVFSKKSWEGLSKDDQALVKKLSAEAQQEQRKLWDDYTKEAETKLKALGVQFAPADKAAFFKATQPIRDKYGSKYATLIKKIQDTK
jgi:tripartite ATP-independent transporter DctP family solute receptor